MLTKTEKVLKVAKILRKWIPTIDEITLIDMAYDIVSSLELD
jgi:hypothetical protein